MRLGPGIHRISKDEYHADPCEQPSLSSSIAGILVSECPAHAWHAHPRGGGAAAEHTKATDEGTLIDTLLIGGDTEIVEVDAADWRTKAAREARDAAREAGKLAVLSHELRAARETAIELRGRLAAKGISLAGENQLTLIWDEESAHGPVRCRARLDHWRPEIATIYDLKKTRSAHPRALSRVMTEYGYDIQAAAYTRAMEKLIPEMAGRVRFVFLFVEIEKTREVVPAHPSGQMRALGESRWRRAVEAWGRGIATGVWPGYSEGEIEIEPTPWAMAEMENLLAGGSQNVPF